MKTKKLIYINLQKLRRRLYHGQRVTRSKVNGEITVFDTEYIFIYV